MANEHRIDTQGFVQRRFERQEAKNGVGRFPDLLSATRPPRPDCRAYVVCGADTGPAQLFFKTEIEVRRVDADKNIGGIFDPAPHETAAQADKPRNVPQRFDEAHDGQRF